jgi:fumarate hydratase class II
LVTALNAELGYEHGAAVVAEARRSGKPLREVVVAATGWSAAQVARRLDPLHLTKP